MEIQRFNLKQPSSINIYLTFSGYLYDFVSVYVYAEILCKILTYIYIYNTSKSIN